MQAVAYISLRKINGILFSKISLIIPPKQPVMVPNVRHINGCKSAFSPFWIPIIVNNPNPKLSKIKSVTLKFFSIDLKIMENRQVKNISEQVIISVIQKTGTSNSKSLTVPPPTDVTNAIIKTPNGSRRFCIAAKLPDIAKDIVPRISIIRLICSCTA